MTLTQIKTSAIALAAALGGAGIAVVLAQPGFPARVVVAQSEHTYYTGVKHHDGGLEMTNRSCGRVLNALDAGIVSEPCFEKVLNDVEAKCAAAYFGCVVLPRVKSAAGQ